MIDTKSKIKNQKSKISDSPQASKKATSMEELMKKFQSSLPSLQKGQTLNGTITKLTPSEILIDINAKSEAVVLEKDKKILRNILSTFKVGDKVDVYILDPESDKGNPVVSLRKTIGDVSWKRLADNKEAKKEMDVFVTETTKGGYLIQTEEGLTGFLPNSHVLPNTNPGDVLNKKIKAFVLEMNKAEKRIIFSQKAVLGKEEFEKATKGLKPEQKIDAIVSNITPFGVFVNIQNKDLGSIDGLIHISEISWDKVENMDGLFSVGQKVSAQIIGFDKDAKRVDLSIKRMTLDPFDKAVGGYSVDQKVKGKVSKIISSGVVLDISENIEGFIRKEKIPPTVSYKVGDEIETTISQIDKKRRKLILVPVLTVKPIGYR